MKREELIKYLEGIGRKGGLKRTPKQMLARMSNLEKLHLKRTIDNEISRLKDESLKAFELLSLFTEEFGYGETPKEYVGARTRIGSRIRQLRMKLANLSGTHTEEEWKELLKKHDGKCVICKTSERITKDHIVPVSDGGSNHIDNIRPLCLKCNVQEYFFVCMNPLRKSQREDELVKHGVIKEEDRECSEEELIEYVRNRMKKRNGFLSKDRNYIEAKLGNKNPWKLFDGVNQ